MHTSCSAHLLYPQELIEFIRPEAWSARLEWVVAFAVRQGDLCEMLRTVLDALAAAHRGSSPHATIALYHALLGLDDVQRAVLPHAEVRTAVLAFLGPAQSRVVQAAAP